MAETFLILLAGGVLLAAVVSNPHQVTLHWLRLGGIIALSLAGLSIFFYWRRGAHLPEQNSLYVACAVAILGQLAFAQVAWRNMQRLFAAAAFLLAVVLGADLMLPSDRWHQMPAAQNAVLLCSAFGVASMCGLALMDMLLGHAYLTASKMTMQPFRRLNFLLIVALILRSVIAVAVALVLQKWKPTEILWGLYGLYILTRWLVGLLVPAVFLYMAHDCIKRRATQSATGILYVAGVLIFIGEIIGLHLVNETGLTF